MEDFYPMPMFVNLEVSDLDSSIEWCQKALGFRVAYSSPDLTHLRRERYQDLLLYTNRSPEIVNPGDGTVVQFQVGESSVNEITAKAQQAGASDVEKPVEQP
jgi:predicted lactoylglutathione lyase